MTPEELRAMSVKLEHDLYHCRVNEKLFKLLFDQIGSRTGPFRLAVYPSKGVASFEFSFTGEDLEEFLTFLRKMEAANIKRANKVNSEFQADLREKMGDRSF